MRYVSTIFFLAVLGLIIYVGFMLSWPYYKAWQYETDARDIVRFERMKLPNIKEKLIEKADELDIPVVESSIQVTQDYEGTVMATVSWSEEVDIFGYYQRYYEFKFDVGGRELGTAR